MPLRILFPSIALIATATVPLLRAAPDNHLIESRPLQAKSTGSGDQSSLFEKIPGPEIGIEMSYSLDPKHKMNRLYPFGWATGNCAIGDFDKDDRLDLFFAGTTHSHRLFVQEKNGFRFRDVTAESGIGNAPDVWSSAAVAGDVDQDGDLDIYVVNFASPNQLFVNISSRSGVKFTEMAADYGIALSGGCLGASFADFNSDGWLDLFVQTYHYEPERGRPAKLEVRNDNGIARISPEWEEPYVGYFDQERKGRFAEAGLRDLLFVNNRKGQFLAAATAGIQEGRTYGTSHLWWDFDNDQRPDLYCGNDSHGPDLFYRQARQNAFADAGPASVPCSPWFARGAVAADFNNDLLIDLFATSHSPLSHRGRLRYGEPFPSEIYRNFTSGGTLQVARNVLLANTGSTRFEEVARMAGVARTGASWAVTAGDYDCDGRIDLFVGNGEARDWTSVPGSALAGESLTGKTRWDVLEKKPALKQRDIAFRNLGGWRFKDTSREWGLDHAGMSYNASQGDLDGDGDLDLVVCRLGEPVTIYRNHCQEPRAVFAFQGESSNSKGIGVEMMALLSNGPQLRQLYPTGGFKSSNEPAMHIGLGNANRIERVTFRWPGGTSSATFEKIKAGRRYLIREGSNSRPAVAIVRRAPLFRGLGSMRGVGYAEAKVDPGQIQPGLPEALSIAGPGMAAADLDQDGLAEIYVTGSAGRGGMLVARSPQLARFPQPFIENSPAEESVAVFFDANGDGALDLFVGGGGVEFGGNDALLQDRLYLNLGKGRFARAPKGSLPSLREITGAAAAADFDRDGDLDLFTGSRMRRHHYPYAGRSALLVNDGNAAFEDKANGQAPGLADAGMVTGAIWSDANGDGWLDLFVTTDWGTPRLWINERGFLREATVEAGLSELRGRWNGVTGRDIDNDGDIDYLLANQGLNNDLPSQMVFSQKFPDSERPAVIFSVEENGNPLTSRNWSNWAGLPSIKKKASNPAQFVSRLDEIFDFSNQAAQANELRTGVLINQGSTAFRFIPLPRGAQVAPVYGMILTDFNFDGRCDAFVLQNDAPPSIQNPDPAGSGVSRLFYGTGNSNRPFIEISPAESGLVFFGMGRAALVTDLNADSRPDLICGLNKADPAVLLNYEARDSFQPIKVGLDFSGKQIPGAKVTVKIANFPTQTAEFYAGGGYRSQSPSDLFFGAPANPKGPAQITIQWADGTVTRRIYYFENR